MQLSTLPNSGFNNNIGQIKHHKIIRDKIGHQSFKGVTDRHNTGSFLLVPYTKTIALKIQKTYESTHNLSENPIMSNVHIFKRFETKRKLMEQNGIQ